MQSFVFGAIIIKPLSAKLIRDTNVMLINLEQWALIVKLNEVNRFKKLKLTKMQVRHQNGMIQLLLKEKIKIIY